MRFRLYNPIHYLSLKRIKSLFASPKSIAITLSGFFIATLAIIYIGNRMGIFFQVDPGADPLGYWKLDEGQGSTAYTSVGSENGTLFSGNSAPTWVTENNCVSGKCLLFDGTNDAISLGDPLAANNSTLGSMSLWFKSIKTDAVQPQIMIYVHNALDTVEDGFGGGREMHVNLTTSKQVQFFIESWVTGTDLNIISTQTYNDTKWHHVTAVWDKSGSGLGYLYVDGNVVGTGSMSTINSYTLDGNVYLARPHLSTGNYRMFGGFLDEVKVYNYARTAAQAKSDFAARGTVRGIAAQFGDDDLSRKLSSGLVGYWKMDEVGVSGSNWTAVDSSGNNNSGTGEGNASVGTTAAAKFGNGGYFDGNGDRVIVSDKDQLDLSAVDKFSISIWVKSADSAFIAYNGFFTKIGNDVGVNRAGIYLSADSSGQFPYCGAVVDHPTIFGSAGGITDISNQQWHHLVCTYDGAKISMYVDSVLEGSSNYTSGFDDLGGPLYIGADYYDLATRGVEGMLDEARLYNRALDPTEVKALYNFAPGPVGYWKMDEGSSNTCSGGSNDSCDASSNGNDGLWNGDVKSTKGKFGKATSFDGSDDYITVSDNTLFEISGQKTISMWVNPADTSSSKMAISKYQDDTTEEGWRILFSNSGTIIPLIKNDAGNGFTPVTPSYTAGTWHYVTMSWDTAVGTMDFYVNGLNVGSTAITGTFSGNARPLSIGRGLNGSSITNGPFNGKIDDVKIYNYVRTEAQIIQDMNAGHPAPGSPVGSAIAHYKLDEGFGTTAYNAGNLGSTLNGVLGTGNSAPTWTNDGKFGKALSFDGADKLIVTDNTALDIGSGDLTVSMWIKKTGQRGGVGKGHFDPTSPPTDFQLPGYILMMHSDNAARWVIGMDTSNRAGIAVAITNPTQWNHLVGTWSNSEQKVRLYVNGKLGGQSSAVGTVTSLSSATDFFMGCLASMYCDGINVLNGSIDEVKVYSSVLNADQVKAEYVRGQAIVLGSTSTGVGGTSPDNSAGREYCVPGDSSTCSAPVGEWLFNKGVGATIYDTSGNSYNGNFGLGASVPSWTKGKYGGGLKFDGSGDYTYIADNANLDASTAFSVSVWVKSTGTSGRILSKHNENITNGWSMGLNVGGTAYWDVTGPSHQAIYSVTPINDGKWHMVTGTLNGTDQRLYIDGRLDASRTWSGTPEVNNLDLVFGRILANSITTDFFVGSIDSVRIYQYVRTPAQIAWEYNQGAPVAYYKMDECTGTAIKDWGPNANGGFNGNTGTLTIGASGTQTAAGTCVTSGAWFNGATGKREASLNFDGTDDYITVGASSTLNLSTFTLAAWIKRSSTARYDTIVQRYNESTPFQGYGLRFTNSGAEGVDKLCLWTGGAAESWLCSSQTVTDTNWHYVTATFDGTTRKIYIDGILGASNEPSSSLSNASDSLYIGSIGGSTGYFRGQLDEVKIFNYALTPAQIKTEMNSGAVRFQ